VKKTGIGGQMKAPRNRKPTTDAVEILHRRYFEGKPERLAALEEERANAEIARKICELRTKAEQKASRQYRDLEKSIGEKLL
jgi:hypothetical protein